jgi:hypothetical protein
MLLSDCLRPGGTWSGWIIIHYDPTRQARLDILGDDRLRGRLMKLSAQLFYRRLNSALADGAAALLDIKPTTLESRIKKLGLV